MKDLKEKKKLKQICIVLGILHAIVMTVFALGPELAPLTVYLVDYPVWVIIAGLKLPVHVELVLMITICSFAYPLIVYGSALFAKWLCRNFSIAKWGLKKGSFRVYVSNNVDTSERGQA